MKVDLPLVVIIIIGLITVSGFVATALNYGQYQIYPPWFKPDLHKPAMISVPVVNGTVPLSATLYDAYGNPLANLTQVSTNSSFVTFSTGSFEIVPNYAYKVWVPQQNTTYDFGLQSPPIDQANAQYYHVTLNTNMVDQFWRPDVILSV